MQSGALLYMLWGLYIKLIIYSQDGRGVSCAPSLPRLGEVGNGAADLPATELPSALKCRAGLHHAGRPKVLTARLQAGCAKAGNSMLNCAGSCTSLQALRHGISKALQAMDPVHKSALRSEGLLTRDNRVVERKKPGKPKARKSFQWVKR